MRNLISLALLILVACPALGSDGALPNGAIKKGSLANAKLIADAKVGVSGKVASLGCDEPEGIEQFVVVMPSGPAGKHAWKELWVVSGCGSKYSINIDFKEDGTGSADWSIGN